VNPWPSLSIIGRSREPVAAFVGAQKGLKPAIMALRLGTAWHGCIEVLKFVKLLFGRRLVNPVRHDETPESEPPLASSSLSPLVVLVRL
jgi:hypothetical protein